jgi:hypothetical protein
MCFSAQADLAAGLVVGAIGVDVLRHTGRPAERALAAIPVVLAGHSLMEAIVWLGLQHHVPAGVWRPALWLYLAVAFGVLPVLVPVAIGALEPASNRRRLGWFTAIGAGVAVLLTYPIVRGPIEATIEGHHIDYRVNLWHGGTLVFLYVVATCGSLLASQRAHVRWFGAANLVVACALASLNKSGFISLWCFWAAITSVSIAVHLRAAHPPPRALATVNE